jgi:hypothetical protein
MVPELLRDELQLFWYRHKITWAYAQSRELKKLLKQETLAIQSCREDFQQQTGLAALLKKANNSFSRYVALLTGLESQRYTIETNLYNYRNRLVKLNQKTGFNFPNLFTQEVDEKYLRQIQTDHASFSTQLKLIENIVASVHAQEMHKNVNHISAVQRKVEWLEVFFASYYAAALAHYISSDFGFSKASYGAWSVAGGAVLAGLLTLVGLQPWRHSHEETPKRYPWWLWLGIAMIMAVGWFVVGYLYFRGSGGGSH